MKLDKTLAHAIRFLSVDAVEQAQSGHPGMPLGMADIATVLWQKFLRHNPNNPKWFNRDRFILSNGHGSMLQYALLHLTGYDLSIQELKNFRSLHSKTPGHPECIDTPGIETTTGPLGQGLANAVGMAIAEQTLAAEFNREKITLVDHYTYVFVGDGCLMEGISHEVCSLAGTLQLGKLIVFYDDNGISIDGKTTEWFTDDTATRFRSYHWHVIDSVDGHDMEAVEQAIFHARQETSKPSLIICKTIIGFGSAMSGSEKTHGAPLGADDVNHLRSALGWSHPPFVIPEEIYAQWNQVEQGIQAEQEWLDSCYSYQQSDSDSYLEFLRRINGDLPDNWHSQSDHFITHCLAQTTSKATRKASQECLNHYAQLIPELLGGSADLTASNNTDWRGSVAITAKNQHGNYIHYGVREFGMSAIMTGIALHGGFIPYGGTFLVFSDYARNAIRMSALMKQRVIFIYTHDSIGLGEDGPTHQPVEHISMLRMTPNLMVWRPADLLETSIAWQQAIEHHTGPSCLLLSRQTLPALIHTNQHKEGVERGGYILNESEGTPDAILIATGSEVALAVESAALMQLSGIQIRVVSMPCAERFLAQDPLYQEKVLPKNIRKRIALEAAASGYWYRFVGLDGMVIGLDTFGASAPYQDLYQEFGISVPRIVDALNVLLCESFGEVV